jgi:hypothetical protein
MKRLFLPLLLALLGLGGGIGAGLFLRPPPEDLLAAAADPCGEAEARDDAAGEEPPADPEGEPTRDYVKLNNQFVVPVIAGGEVASLVILSLTLEVAPGTSEQVYAHEPKLRDEFLQVLFDHANVGGFDGAFTDGNNLDVLRKALREAARTSMGEAIRDVLITDIVRQAT